VKGFFFPSQTIVTGIEGNDYSQSEQKEGKLAQIGLLIGNENRIKTTYQSYQIDPINRCSQQATQREDMILYLRK
jgi:hypothetical protein